MASKQNELLSILSSNGLMHSVDSVGIPFLFSDYCAEFDCSDKELLRTAIEICDRELNPYSGQITRKSILERIQGLKLEKKDYADTALSLLTSNNGYARDYVTSNESLCELAIQLLDINAKDHVLDLGSGYGTFLGMVSKSGKDECFRPALQGQEINVQACAISKMLLTMCGANFQIDNVNSIEKMYVPSFTKGYVFPPFGIRYDFSVGKKFNSKGIELVNSRTSSEWMFVLTALEGMNKAGRMVVLLPEGALFKAPDAPIRKYLVENGLIEGIISLPTNSFAWSSIKTSILVLSHGNESFKMVDGETVLKDLPIKGLASHEAAKDLFNAYNASDVLSYNKKDIKSEDCVLTLSVLKSKDVYESLENAVELTEVADVLRGSPLTLANFKDNITSIETNYKILTSSNIENGIIDYDSLPYIGDGKKFEKFVLRKNDIVVTSKSTKVKVAVVTEEPEKNIIVTGGMLIIRPKTDKINSTYIKMFLDSAKGREVLASVQKGTIITTISYDSFKKIKIPCPQLEKQEYMSKKFNSLLAVYDGMKKELQEMESRLATFFEDYSKED